MKPIRRGQPLSVTVIAAGAAAALLCAPPVPGGQPAEDHPAITSGAPLRDALLAAATRRVDVVGIGDSNQLLGGHGWDHGMQHALSRRFPMYATGLLCVNGNIGWGHNIGYGYNMAAGANWANGVWASYSGAPLPFHDYMPATGFLNEQFSATHRYLWTDPDSISAPTSPCGVIVLLDCPLDASANLRHHLCHAVFAGEGDGQFLQHVRLAAPPYTPLTAQLVQTEGAAADALVTTTLDLPADIRGGPLEFRMHQHASEWRGRQFHLYQRVENLDRAAGYSYHTWSAHGSKSLRHFANMIINQPRITPLYKHHFFQQVRALQDDEPLVIFWINHGLNDRSESLPSVGPNPQSDGDSPEAFYDNLVGSLDRIEADWVASGGALSQVRFALMVSHAQTLPDDAELASYRAMARQVASERPRTTAIDLDLLVDAPTMEAQGLYLLINGAPHLAHLSQPGYENIALRVLDALLGPPPCNADLNGDGEIDVDDLVALIVKWGACPGCYEDLNVDGVVGVDDLVELLVTWGECG